MNYFVVVDFQVCRTSKSMQLCLLHTQILHAIRSIWEKKGTYKHMRTRVQKTETQEKVEHTHTHTKCTDAFCGFQGIFFRVPLWTQSINVLYHMCTVRFISLNVESMS